MRPRCHSTAPDPAVTNDSGRGTMNGMRTIKVTSDMRADALRRVYDGTPRVLRLTPGHLRWIARVDEQRRQVLGAPQERHAS